MSSAYTLIQAALIGEFDTDQRGRPVSYNGESINAIYYIGQNPDGLGRVTAPKGRQMAGGHIKVLKRDVTAWEYRDKVVIDGLEWRIQGLIADRSFYWKLRMESVRRRGV